MLLILLIASKTAEITLPRITWEPPFDTTHKFFNTADSCG
jgi:hypothetical protein